MKLRRLIHFPESAIPKRESKLFSSFQRNYYCHQWTGDIIKHGILFPKKFCPLVPLHSQENHHASRSRKIEKPTAYCGWENIEKGGRRLLGIKDPQPHHYEAEIIVNTTNKEAGTVERNRYIHFGLSGALLILYIIQNRC